MCKKWENICSVHICWYIGIKFCTVVYVVHILNISNNTKLYKSKISHYGVKYSNSVLKCSSFIRMPLRLLSTSANEWPCTSTGPVGNSEGTTLLICTVIFFVWRLVRQRNGGSISGQKSATILRDSEEYTHTHTLCLKSVNVVLINTPS